MNPTSTSSSLDSSSGASRGYNSSSSPPSLDLLCDPATTSSECHVLSSPPLSPQRYNHYPRHHHHAYLVADVDNSSGSNGSYGKPRNRFSEYEDAVICEGVAKGLTWGQISGKLPHRKRATCFNRYRTLQGIRKSRKRLASCTVTTMLPMMNTPPSSRRASICSQQPFFTPSPSPPLSTLSMTPPLSSTSSASGYATTSSVQQHAPRIITTTISCLGGGDSMTTSSHYEWMMRNQPYRHGWMEQQQQQQSSDPYRNAGRRGYY